MGRTSSSFKKSSPAKSIMLVIGMLLLFAGGFIVAFLVPGALFFHRFLPSDHIMLEIGGALLVAGIATIIMARLFT
jgi:hypothetical protein